MAFGKKEDKKDDIIQDSKEYLGQVGQQRVIAINVSGLFNSCEKDILKLNNYLANGWIVKRVDDDRNGTMFYLIEKE
ncbi:MAG: hypothetical protein ACI4WH_07395 [Oscillospiraceae bacterium]